MLSHIHVCCSKISKTAIGLRQFILIVLGAVILSGLCLWSMAGRHRIQAAATSDDCGGTSSYGADLEIDKIVDNPTPNEGEQIVYTIFVMNFGPEDASWIRISDVLPAGVTYSGSDSSDGNYDSGIGRWSIERLPECNSARLVITAAVNLGTAGTTITNTAHYISAEPGDPNSENNVGSIGIKIASKSVNDLFYYLPIIFKDYEPMICNAYNFNETPIGWLIENKDGVQIGYTENNEEYFINRRRSGMRIVQAPISFSNQYTIEVDVRWESTKVGYEHGLIFGQENFPVPTYAFGIGPDPNDPTQKRYRYRLYRILTYNNDDNSVIIDCITKPCWMVSFAIKPTSTNNLRAECKDNKIRLFMNDTPLIEHNSIPYSCAGQVGVFAQSSPGKPNALAYFDNFRISCPSQPDIPQLFRNQYRNILLAPKSSVDFNWVE
jgi:uncharacterized repeat protein (TIGR01451 family)